MERTIIIANTSNMPVAAREASIYTGITLAEYYRDQGYHVAIMADSTSRWAEALRELSGPDGGDAGGGRVPRVPADAARRILRARRDVRDPRRTRTGSITIVGAVSPPGGDFSEPVTQHTKRFVRCLWALDRQLANARHYPAISWLDSYSEYVEEVAGWWQEHGAEWIDLRRRIMDLLQQEAQAPAGRQARRPGRASGHAEDRPRDVRRCSRTPSCSRTASTRSTCTARPKSRSGCCRSSCEFYDLGSRT